MKLFTRQSFSRFTTEANPPQVTISSENNKIVFSSALARAIGLKGKMKVAFAVQVNGEHSFSIGLEINSDGFHLNGAGNSDTVYIRSKQLVAALMKTLNEGIGIKEQKTFVLGFDSECLRSKLSTSGMKIYETVCKPQEPVKTPTLEAAFDIRRATSAELQVAKIDTSMASPVPGETKAERLILETPKITFKPAAIAKIEQEVVEEEDGEELDPEIYQRRRRPTR